MENEKSYGLIYALLAITLAALMFLSLFMGRYATPPGTVVSVLLDKISGTISNGAEATVIWNIRVPRVLLCVMVGAGLSVSGAAFQGIFQNPLVSPDILGVSSGAGFGAALGILLTSGGAGIAMLPAFGFGLLSVIIAYTVSKIKNASSPVSLVLSGMIVGFLFNALISLIKLVADTDSELPAITYWLMGSFANTTFQEIAFVSPLIVGGTIALLLLRWRMNILSMGDEEAYSLGINPNRLRISIIALATVITSASVMVSGIVGWVGLIIPNICRMFVGADHKHLLPTSFFMGGIFVLVIDFLARVLTVAEIPIGILTAIAGAPLFIYVYKYSEWGK
jgi:iron complex transport system permease protein